MGCLADRCGAVRPVRRQGFGDYLKQEPSRNCYVDELQSRPRIQFDVIPLSPRPAASVVTDSGKPCDTTSACYPVFKRPKFTDRVSKNCLEKTVNVYYSLNSSELAGTRFDVNLHEAARGAQSSLSSSEVGCRYF